MSAVECYLFPLCKGLLTEMAEMALFGEEGVGTGAQLPQVSMPINRGRRKIFRTFWKNVLDVV